MSSQQTEQMTALKEEMLEIKEKLLQMRENDILSLREQVNSFSLQLKVWLAIVGVVGAILGGFGVRQYFDFKRNLEEKMNKKIDESVGYYDQLSQALILTNNGGCSSAIPIFTDLSAKRPDDEVALINVLHCFNQLESYDQGYQFITKLKEKGIFPGRMRLILSYNNAGFLVLVKSFSDERLEGEALELLNRAEQIRELEGNTNIWFPSYNLMLFYVARNDESKASIYAARLKDSNSNIDWREDKNRIWFKRLLARRANASEMLERLLPIRAQSSGTLPANQ